MPYCKKNPKANYLLREKNTKIGQKMTLIKMQNQLYIFYHKNNNPIKEMTLNES